MSDAYSIVEYHGEMNKSRCGYCKNTRSSNSHGMTAHFLSSQDYQDLIDRGWRRSGNYCYKPNNRTTCCPSYTIKCDALDFKLSKSHKKILKRMSKFLRDGVRDKQDSVPDNNASGEGDGSSKETEFLLSRNTKINTISKEGRRAVAVDAASDKIEIKPDVPGKQERIEVENSQETTKGHCKKAKLMRLERKQAKLALKGESMEVTPKTQKYPEKSLEEFLSEEGKNVLLKLEVKLVASKEGASNVALDLYKKYQMQIHKDSKVKRSSFERFLCLSPIKVKLQLSSTKDFKQKFGAVEFQLYKAYQTSIHNDPPQHIEEFYNFLVNSPIQAEEVPGTNGRHKYGSFHQQYWLDGKLIAVGVIDILPSLVSSVYFFYDPEYNFLSLGTYGCLREVAFVRELQKTLPELKHYYMGFFIHSCPKMRYKAKLQPSFLLCPEVYSWHLITETILTKLDKCKYQRFNEDQNAEEINKFKREDLKRIPIYNSGKPTFLEQFLRTSGISFDLPQVMEYGSLVGTVCAPRMILVLD